MPSNNESAKMPSFGNKKTPNFSEKSLCGKRLDNSQFNFKGVRDTSHDQENENGYYTKKFERMLEKEDMSKNLESLNHKSVMNNAGKTSSFGHNSAWNKIINIFSEKFSQNETKSNQQREQSSDSENMKVYHCNTEKSSAFANQTKTLLNKTSDTMNIVTYYESSEVTDTVTENSSNQTELEEEYEIFKSGPPTTATGTSRFIPNAQELEPRVDPVTKEIKKKQIKSNMETARAKNNNDFKLSVKELRSDNYLSNDILSALTGEYLRTGITQKNMLEYLRKKETTKTVTQLKKDISVFFNDAAEAGTIKKRKRRFYLNTVEDTAIGNTQQSLKHKLLGESDDFKKSDVTTQNASQKRKFENESSNLELCNYAWTNVVKRRNVGDKVGSSSSAAFELRASTSNCETKIYEREIELKKNTENKQGETESAYLMKMLQPVKNDAQPGSERKKSKEIQDQYNPIKVTILNMIQAARSRRKSIK